MGAARKLRKELTYGERVFWQAVRKGQIGHRVRRQYAVGPYVLDFYIHAARLCIEIDGPEHDPKHDQVRDAYLAELGIRTIRIHWRDIPDRLDYWLGEVKAWCEVRAALQPMRDADQRHPES